MAMVQFFASNFLFGAGWSKLNKCHSSLQGTAGNHYLSPWLSITFAQMRWRAIFFLAYEPAPFSSQHDIAATTRKGDESCLPMVFSIIDIDTDIYRYGVCM